MQEQLMAKQNTILKALTGSKLYGTDRPDSDVDYIGIFIPTQEYILGLKECNEVDLGYEKGGNKIDFVSHNLKKFIRLAIGNNPNIISVLYTPQDRIAYCHSYGDILMNHRELFLSKKAYHTFRGYAHAQKIKMVTQKREGKRKEDVEKFGYDPKFGMHLIRLLYECLDIMVTKNIVYPSPHKKVLSAIRNGEMGLDFIYQEASRIEKLIDEAYVRSDLQYQSDLNKIEKLQIDMLQSYWREYG